MFNFFKRKQQEQSFKENVKKFWQEFEVKEKEIKAAVHHKEQDTVSAHITHLISILKLRLSWSIAPQSKEEKKFVLTLSPEGNKHLYLLAHFWKSLAPHHKDWLFYATKKENPGFGNMILNIEGTEFPFAEATYIVNEVEGAKKLDVVIYHPLFHTMGETHIDNIKFMILDELLGEIVVETMIGQITISLTPNKRSLNYQKFYQLVEKKIHEGSVKKEDLLLHNWYGYTSEPKNSGPLRSDIYVGSTLIPDLLKVTQDPLKNTGASYVYLAFNNQNIAKNNLVHERSRIADRVEEVLKEKQLGYLVGEATGIHDSYLDFVVVDVIEGIKAIEENLAQIREYNFQIKKFWD